MPIIKRAPNEKELEALRKIFLKAEMDIINEIGRLRTMGNIDYHAVASLEKVQAILKPVSYTHLDVYKRQEFERMCDDYLMSYVKEAQYKTLTPEPLVGYILGKETEIKCVRIIMTCKLNNIDSETIKERVREAYV